MSTRTHRTRLARRLTAASDLGYQQALRLVNELADTGRLPSRLDGPGSDAALRLLLEYLSSAQATPTFPAPTPEDVADALLRAAVDDRASHLHAHLTTKGGLTVRVRIDGLLHERAVPPAVDTRGVLGALLARGGFVVPVEQPTPADAWRMYEHPTRGTVAIQSSYGTNRDGQYGAFRLIDAAERAVRTPGELGLSAPVAVAVHDAITEAATSGGLILACGPTGSGKSTTLYTLSQLAGIPLNPFDNQAMDALEVRSAAMLADSVVLAEGGQLVLRTLHTRSARNTLLRLAEVADDPAATLRTVRLLVTQTLLLRVCTQCGGDQVIAGQTCPTCSGRGTRGRVAAFDVIRLSAADADRLAQVVSDRAAFTAQLDQLQPVTTLEESLADLVRRGVVREQDAALYLP